jgi:hypothetical protein
LRYTENDRGSLTTAYRHNDTVETLRKRPRLYALFSEILTHNYCKFHALSMRTTTIWVMLIETNNNARNLSVHRAFKTHNWRSLHYYVLGTCLVNSWSFWSQNRPNLGTEARRGFQEYISAGVQDTPYPTNRRYGGNSMPLHNQEALFSCLDPVEDPWIMRIGQGAYREVDRQNPQACFR